MDMDQKRKTLFWAIELDVGKILDTMSQFISDNLTPLKEMHSTLLFVGKKMDPREEKYFAIEGQLCELAITQFGKTDNAIALKVDSIISATDRTLIPSDNTIQHITVALAEGVKPVNSVESFSNMIVLDKPLFLSGKVKRY